MLAFNTANLSSTLFRRTFAEPEYTMPQAPLAPHTYRYC